MVSSKKTFSTLLLFTASLTISLLTAEYLARLVLDPVDFLLPQVVQDPLLGHRIAERSGGHDEWGFRNRTARGKFDIVAIGDSMTYGVSARMNGAWPQQLQAMTGVRTYNLALGGYGPVQYQHLLATKAAAIRPSIVIIALYLGNDLIDCVNAARTTGLWMEELPESLRTSKPVENVAPSRRSKFLGGVRNWLSQQSILYALASRSVLGDLVRDKEMSDRGLVMVKTPLGSDTFVSPNRIIPWLDTSEETDAGMKVLRKSIAEMKEEIDKRGYAHLFLIIPTKETVLSTETTDVAARQSLSDLASIETKRGTEIATVLREQGLEFLDLLQPLRLASRSTDIYPEHDGHPNEAGYATIAAEVAARLSLLVARPGSPL